MQPVVIFKLLSSIVWLYFCRHHDGFAIQIAFQFSAPPCCHYVRIGFACVYSYCCMRTSSSCFARVLLLLRSTYLWICRRSAVALWEWWAPSTLRETTPPTTLARFSSRYVWCLMYMISNRHLRSGTHIIITSCCVMFHVPCFVFHGTEVHVRWWQYEYGRMLS